MHWMIWLYLAGAAIPAVVVMGHDGWQSGWEGERPTSDPEDLRAAALLGVSWPIWVAALIVYLAAWSGAWLAGAGRRAR
jgi:hypothetical protein